MTTNFPTSLDSFTNPTGSDALGSATVPHATQHANVNDAVEALEAKVGVDGSAVTSSLEYRLTQIESGGVPAAGSDGQVQYNNGGVAGGASSLTYDDVNGRVGIGTATPAATLQVVGSSLTSGNVDVGGYLNVDSGTLYANNSTNRVGVGTTSPTAHLDVRGQVIAHGSTGAYTTTQVGAITINNNSADDTVDFTQGIVFTDNVNGSGPWTHAGIVAVGSASFNGSLVFGTDGDSANNTTGITERMRINSSGVVTMPSQPSVFAFSPGTDQVAGGVSPVKVAFNNTQHNTGGHYSTALDRFTCPVAGEYLVSWYALGGAPEAVYRYYLRINGATWNDLHVRANGTYDGYTRTVILDLAASDYLEVWYNSDDGSSNYTSGGNTYFTFVVRLLG